MLHKCNTHKFEYITFTLFLFLIFCRWFWLPKRAFTATPHKQHPHHWKNIGQPITHNQAVRWTPAPHQKQTPPPQHIKIFNYNTIRHYTSLYKSQCSTNIQLIENSIIIITHTHSLLNKYNYVFPWEWCSTTLWLAFKLLIKNNYTLSMMNNHTKYNKNKYSR